MKCPKWLPKAFFYISATGLFVWYVIKLWFRARGLTKNDVPMPTVKELEAKSRTKIKNKSAQELADSLTKALNMAKRSKYNG